MGTKGMNDEGFGGFLDLCHHVPLGAARPSKGWGDELRADIGFGEGW